MQKQIRGASVLCCLNYTQRVVVQMDFKMNSNHKKGGIVHFIVKFRTGYQTWHKPGVIWYN